MSSKHAGGSKSKAVKKEVYSGTVHILSTFNNTKVTITDVQGNVIAWSSAGCVDFSGSRKSTPYAAQVAVEDAVKKARPYNLKTVDVRLKGAGGGKEMAARALVSAGLNVSSIRDVSPRKHGGCRAPKRRRV
jgi:small subunit ribosomal protein S11